MDLIERSGISFAAHLWQTTRFDFFLSMLAREGAFRPGARVLDVGSGDAWFAKRLIDEVPSLAAVTCWDAGYDDPGTIAQVRADASPKLSLCHARPEAKFDLVLALDVIEHVEDDRAFLGAIARENLAPGGFAFVSVPAWNELFGEHDWQLKHYRRYSAELGRRTVASAGLEIVRSGGVFYAPLAVRAAQVLAERVLGAANGSSHAAGDGRTPPAPVAALARAAFRGEKVLATSLSGLGVDIPGLSWWALCRKPS